MVATDNGTRLSDMELRHAVERVMEKRLWNSMRAAVEIGCTEATLMKWLENPHETAMTVFRSKLVRFVRTFDAPAPAREPEVAAAVAPSEAALATMAAEFFAAEAAAIHELPLTATAEITEDPDTGEFQVGAITLSPDNPLPFGFAILMPVRTGFSGYPAALVVRDKSVAITTALRTELGDATHVVIGVESRTDRPDGYAAIAIAPIGTDHPWFSHAHKLTQSGEWGTGFRSNLGLPSDVYIAERQGNAPLWICRPREWATERTAA